MANNTQLNEFDILSDNKGGIMEVSEDTFYNALGSVPPLYRKNCFAMGEIADHTGEGEPIYYHFGQIKDGENWHYFGILDTTENAEQAFDAIKGNKPTLN